MLEGNVIRIAEDFSQVPGGRYRTDGPANGEAFREDFLEPILRARRTATVVLDGTRGYPSSFLEEAFGGLIRLGYSEDEILGAFRFQANQPGFSRFVDRIKEHVNRAATVTTS